MSAQDVFILLLSNSVLTRTFCLKEITWALQYNKCVARMRLCTGHVVKLHINAECLLHAVPILFHRQADHHRCRGRVKILPMVSHWSGALLLVVCSEASARSLPRAFRPARKNEHSCASAAQELRAMESGPMRQGAGR